MIPTGVYVCPEHGERVAVERVLDYVDGAVLLPATVICAECGAQLLLVQEGEASGGN